MKPLVSAVVVCVVALFARANGLTFSTDPTSDVLSTVSTSFLSVALDTGLIASADFSNPTFSKLVKLLAPMHFRIGGTAADVLSFVDDSDLDTTSKVGDDLVLTASSWLKLAEFAKNSEVTILFDLNSLLRNEDGSWNQENAEQLIKFSREHDIELDWELGNEPDLYQALYSREVSAYQLAVDYHNLRALLDQYQYDSSLLVGPSMFDVGSSDSTTSYLWNFVYEASSSISAVTWHQYYFNGRDATEELFLNPETFDYLKQRTEVVNDIVGASKRVWLGETSSCYNQGAPGMSDRVLASFLWLDKLGLGAQLGLDVIVRQTIWGYNYPLLDSDYNPNPDWWISALYKKFVGPKVLSIENDGGDSLPVRLYAHCAKPDDQWGDNAVVVFGINLANSTQKFSLSGFSPEVKTDGNLGFLFELTAETDLYSQSFRLNGGLLSLTEDLELPDLGVRIIDMEKIYTMAAHSLAFWLLPNSRVQACK
ncbi:heparanase [Dendroctonus ponderosae]